MICQFCGKDTRKNSKDYYMLTPELWGIITRDLNGFMCMDCVEDKLGRNLQREDITACPQNVFNNLYTSLLFKEYEIHEAILECERRDLEWKIKLKQIKEEKELRKLARINKKISK
jgi:hypothetical protein